jgi:hypothetical protein
MIFSSLDKAGVAYTCPSCKFQGIFASDYCTNCGYCFVCEGIGYFRSENDESELCLDCGGHGKKLIKKEKIITMSERQYTSWQLNQTNKYLGRFVEFKKDDKLYCGQVIDCIEKEGIITVQNGGINFKVDPKTITRIG